MKLDLKSVEARWEATWQIYGNLKYHSLHPDSSMGANVIIFIKFAALRVTQETLWALLWGHFQRGLTEEEYPSLGSTIAQTGAPNPINRKGYRKWMSASIPLSLLPDSKRCDRLPCSCCRAFCALMGHIPSKRWIKTSSLFWSRVSASWKDAGTAPTQ